MFARPKYANVTSTLALFIALGGTSYAAITVTGKNVKNSSLTGADIKSSSLTGSDIRNNSLTGGDVRNGSLRAADFRAGELPAGPTGPAGAAGTNGSVGPAGPKGDPGPVEIIDSSFVFQEGDGVVLPGAAPANSQVNFASSNDPEVSGGLLNVSQPGIVHAEATVILNRAPGAGGVAFCEMRVSGGVLSNTMRTTFSDAGTTAGGDQLSPTVTMPLVGTARIATGTQNIGVRCWADRPDLIRMSNTELHAVVYPR